MPSTTLLCVTRTNDVRHYGKNISLTRSDYNARYHDGFRTPDGKLRNRLNAKSSEAWNGTEQEAIQFALQIPNCVGFTRNGTTGSVYFSSNTTKRKWRTPDCNWRHEWSIVDISR